jgi:hypothetical protein
MMLQAFPSAQSSITADSPKVYLFAVEEFSIEALKRACRAIVRGEVKDLKPEFPPAAPKLAQIVKDCEDALIVERFEAEHRFVEVGSPLWLKLEAHRQDRALPTYERTMPDGSHRRGWNFKFEEVVVADRLPLPSVIPEADMIQRRKDIAARGFSVGDRDGHEDAA